MRIVLVRHGKPDTVSVERISGRNIGHWVRQYDHAGVSKALVPSASTLVLAASAGCVLVSTLPRARQSAAWLAPQTDPRVDPDLREAALPESLPSSIRLPPGVWVVLARLIWWLNWCKSEESVVMARERARRVADRLALLAAEHGSVMSVGHGMFNRFVASELRRRGWRGPMFLAHGYWAASQFHNGQRPVSDLFASDGSTADQHRSTT